MFQLLAAIRVNRMKLLTFCLPSFKCCALVLALAVHCHNKHMQRAAPSSGCSSKHAGALIKCMLGSSLPLDGPCPTSRSIITQLPFCFFQNRCAVCLVTACSIALHSMLHAPWHGAELVLSGITLNVGTWYGHTEKLEGNQI